MFDPDKMVREIIASAVSDGLDVDGYVDRLNEDARRMVEFLNVALLAPSAFVVTDEAVAIDRQYLNNLQAVLVAWVARFFEIAESPSRLIRSDGKNPFDGERKIAKAFILKYDLPVSFRDALKHW